MKRFIYATLFSLLSLVAIGQNISYIGDGTIVHVYPPQTSTWDYSWCDMIYTSDELGGEKTINEIGFDQTVDFGTGYWNYAQTPDQKIYMKLISEDQFVSAAHPDPTNAANGYTLVYDGTGSAIQFNLSWSFIELDAPFEYDGTSHLEILWVSEMGNDPAMVNVKFNSTAQETDFRVKMNGSDSEYPTSDGAFYNERPNLAVSYTSDANEPATPVNPFPINNEYKSYFKTNLSVDLGINTDTYDIYFGESEETMNLILEDAAFSSNGTHTIELSSIGITLETETQYFWKVVAKNATATTASEIWNFRTEQVLETPYFYGFEDSLINNSNHQYSSWTWPLTGPANWRTSNIWAYTGQLALTCNVWLYEGDYSIITPRINLDEDSRLNFWWRISNVSAEEETKDLLPAIVFVEISDDNQQTWNLVDTLDTEYAMNEWEQCIKSIGSYSGDDVFIRLRYQSNSLTNPYNFVLDDFSIEPNPNGAISHIQENALFFDTVAMGGRTYLELPVKNTGSQYLVIENIIADSPFSGEINDSIAPGETKSVLVYFSPETNSNFNGSLMLEGDFSGDKTVSLNGYGMMPISRLFENFDLSRNIPEHWNIIRTKDPYDYYTTVSIVTGTYDPNSYPNAAKIQKMNDTISPLVFVTPGVSDFETNELIFSAKTSVPDYTLQLAVGVMSDPYNFADFDTVAVFDVHGTHNWDTVTFAGKTGPYIGFMLVDGGFAQAIILDDVSWDLPISQPPYPATLIYPLQGATDVDIMTSTLLQWTSGGGAPLGYNFYLGTNEAADNLINGLPITDALIYDAIASMNYGTHYYWKIVPYNEHGSTSEGIETWEFTTMGDPLVTTLPFEENFDAVVQTSGFDYPLGWSLENGNDDNFAWDIIQNYVLSSLAHSSPNSMHMVFSLQTMNDWMYTPPIQLEEGESYRLSFWYQTTGDQYVPNPVEKIKVAIGTDNNSSFMNDVIYVNEELSNQEWRLAEVVFTATESDNYFIGIQGYSEPNQGILTIDDIYLESYTNINDKSVNESAVYPNPAKDILYISGATGKTVKIYNVAGKLAYENAIEADFSISTDRFNQGLYIIQIIGQNSIESHKVFIK